MNKEIEAILLDSVRKVMDILVKEKKSVRLEIKEGFLSSYDDASGQRDSYLSFFSYTSNGVNSTEQDKYSPNTYFLRRRLSFTNKGDENKEDAILTVINMDRLKDFKSLKLTDSSIQIDNITLHYR